MMDYERWEKTQMCAQYYRMNLENYACPGFASHSKAYYGTISQFQAFMNALASGEKSRENYADLIEAFCAYMNGNKEVCYRVLYHEELLLTPVDLIKMKFVTLENLRWEHLNIWGCPYVMSCDKVETVHTWLKDKNGYVRCITARFEGLRYNDRSLDGFFLGFPCMFAEEGETTFHRLAVVEQRFKNEQECLEDCATFSETDIDFTEICNDIFGDG